MKYLKELKKEIIKNVIKPFFKKHGFLNKGVNFYKDFDKNFGVFQLNVQIQSQRYYKEEDKEKFRLNFELYMPEFNQKVEEKSFGSNWIGEEDGGWVILTLSTNYDEISLYLNQKLEEKLTQMTEKMELKNLLSRYENRPFSEKIYPFLLKKYDCEKYPLWLEGAKQELEDIRLKVKDLENQKEEQNRRKKSLDQELKITGIMMKINDLEWKKQSIEKAINFMENLDF